VKAAYDILSSRQMMKRPVSRTTAMPADRRRLDLFAPGRSSEGEAAQLALQCETAALKPAGSSPTARR
jgi:hypothetical protein